MRCKSTMSERTLDKNGRKYKKQRIYIINYDTKYGMSSVKAEIPGGGIIHYLVIRYYWRKIQMKYHLIYMLIKTDRM